MPLLHRALPILVLSSLLACNTLPDDLEDCSQYGLTHAPAPEGVRHIACTSTGCGDGLNPPTSGNHCGDTLRCRSHSTEQNRCVWLHNMEHGHAIFLYNCPDGCPDIVAALESLREEAKAGSNGVRRAIVAPDSKIPTRVAAVMWRRSWAANEVNPNAIRCLLQYQDFEVPEPNLACQP